MGLQWQIIFVVCELARAVVVGAVSSSHGHGRPLGAHGAPVSELPSLHWPSEEAKRALEPDHFWNTWMRSMEPLMIRNVSSRFPAFHKWSDDYVVKQFGDLVVRLEKKNESQFVQDIPDRVTLSKYYSDLQHVGYVVSQLPSPMAPDVEVLPFLSCGPNKDAIVEADLWISSGATHSLLHKDAFNQVNCLLKGRKEWILIDPKFTKDIPMFYESGPPEHALAGKSKLDPTAVDLKKYPKVGRVPFWKTTQNEGDCIFLPGSLLHQVNADKGRSIAVSILFGGPTSLTRFHGEVIPELNRTDMQCGALPLGSGEGVPSDLHFPKLSDMFIAWDYSGHGPMTMGIGLPQDASRMLEELLISRKMSRMKKDDFVAAYKAELEEMFPRDPRFHSDDLNSILDSMELLIPSKTRESWVVKKTRGGHVCEIVGAKQAALSAALEQARDWYQKTDPSDKGLTRADIKMLTPHQLIDGLAGFFFLQTFMASSLETLGEQATTFRDDDTDAFVGQEERGGSSQRSRPTRERNGRSRERNGRSRERNGRSRERTGRKERSGHSRERQGRRLRSARGRSRESRNRSVESSSSGRSQKSQEGGRTHRSNRRSDTGSQKRKQSQSRNRDEL